MNKITILIISLLFVYSCKNESTKPAVEVDEITAARNTYKENSNQENAKSLLTEIQKKLINTTNEAKEYDLLTEGLDLAKKYRMGKESNSFLTTLVKYHPKAEKYEEYYAALTASLLGSSNKTPGNFLASGYKQRYPNGQFTDQVLKDARIIDQPKEVITATAESVFHQTAQSGTIDTQKAKEYVNLCEAYALAFPNDDEAPSLLYKAGEIAASLRTFDKSMHLFDWIIRKYPNKPEAPMALFMKGFVFENEIGDIDNAGKVYQQFIEKYPDHHLASSAKFLKENLGKSDEELIKVLEENKKNQETNR